ncbi:MAG TPA: hypothetical protein DEF45_22140 [Rhodopirellula sp.]|nr:hypothetical protein [Rhodopirellula sp.]
MDSSRKDTEEAFLFRLLELRQERLRVGVIAIESLCGKMKGECHSAAGRWVHVLVFYRKTHSFNEIFCGAVAQIC